MFKELFVVLVLFCLLSVAVIGGTTYSLNAVLNHGQSNSPQVGAAPGPDRTYPCESRNGVMECTYSAVMTQNASTTCSFKSPAATSTLTWASAQFSLSSSTATIVEIGKGTLQATTTLIGTKYNILASARASILASTSPAAGDATIFAPSTWLNVKVGGGITTGDSAGTGFVPVGTCKATFQLM